MIFMAHGIDDATLTLDTGTAAGNFPLNNLKSRIYEKVFKTGAGSSTNVQIEIDFGSTRACDTLVVGNTNYDSVEGLTLETGTADNGSTYDLENLVDQTCTGTNNYFTFTEATKRYWRLTLADFANNNVDYVGLIFLGQRYETPVNFEYNFDLGYEYNVDINELSGGIDLRYEVGDKRYTEQKLKIKGFTDAQRDSFLDYFNDSEKAQGILKPFFWLPDEETTNPHYGKFTNSKMVFKKIVEDYNEINIGVIQQL